MVSLSDPSCGGKQLANVLFADWAKESTVGLPFPEIPSPQIQPTVNAERGKHRHKHIFPVTIL